jgi:hypothetical protein
VSSSSPGRRRRTFGELCRVTALLAAFGLAPALLAVPGRPAFGDQPTVVLIPRNILTAAAPEGTLAASIGSITATVNGLECATVALSGPSNTNSSGDKVIVLGNSDQPQSCSATGQEIVFLNRSGQRLATKASVSPGSTIILNNLAPEAPHSPGAGPTPDLEKSTGSPAIRPPITGDAGFRNR